jgi:hypothetical protein
MCCGRRETKRGAGCRAHWRPWITRREARIYTLKSAVAAAVSVPVMAQAEPPEPTQAEAGFKNDRERANALLQVGEKVSPQDLDAGQLASLPP